MIHCNLKLQSLMNMIRQNLKLPGVTNEPEKHDLLFMMKTWREDTLPKRTKPKHTIYTWEEVCFVCSLRREEHLALGAVSVE